MDIEGIRTQLLALDREEALAKEFKAATGKSINNFEVKYLLEKGFGKKGGPELLDGFDMAETLRAAYGDRVGDAMEKSVIPEWIFGSGVDVELNYTQRYVANLPHSHGFFEIEYVMSGNCIHYVGSSVLYMSEGDIAVVPPGAKHYVEPEGESLIINLKIRSSTFEKAFTSMLAENTALADYFAGVLRGGDYNEYLSLACGPDEFPGMLLLSIYAQQNEGKPHSAKVIKGLLDTFFAYLVQNYENKMTLSPTKIPAESSAKFTAAEKYIRANYRTVTLTELAQKLYLSPPYLSSQFKKHTGRGFSAFLKEIRLQAAAELLASGSRSVGRVAEEVGYEDTSQFIKNFKQRFGTTPKRYAASIKPREPALPVSEM